MKTIKNTSYKKMLRDRLPLLVSAALKWCKAKECWINHVYDNFINIYADKELRYEATRIMLGISSKYRNFEFDKTIAWDNLIDEEIDSWKSVMSWVEWFQKHAMDIKDEYDLYKFDYDETKIEDYLIDKFLETENKESARKLVRYIITTL